MKSVIAKLNAGFPGDFNAAVKVAVLDAGIRTVAISHADSAFSLKKSVESVKEFFQGDWQAGDVAVLNDPNQGATHVCQLTAVAPHFANGEIAGWTVVRANIPDLGGWLIGGYSPDAIDRWAEAARFVPAKLLLAGRERREVLDLLSLNSRTPQTIRRFALSIGNAALETKPEGLAESYQAPYKNEAVQLLQSIHSLSGKQTECSIEVKAPAGWASPGTIKTALQFTGQGIRVMLTAPTRSTYPINLAETTTKDIVVYAISAGLQKGEIQTDAVAAMTDIHIDGELLAAPAEACVGIGRETSGAAVFETVLNALSKATHKADQKESAIEAWLNREVIAALDWKTGALTADSLGRFLSIESEIAR